MQRGRDREKWKEVDGWRQREGGLKGTGRGRETVEGVAKWKRWRNGMGGG